MKDLRVVFYKVNNAPRSIQLSSAFLFRFLYSWIALAIVVLLLAGLSIRFWILAKHAPKTVVQAPQELEDDVTAGPSNAPESQIKFLKDQVEALRAQLRSKNQVDSMPGKIDVNHPVFGFFPPNVIDRSQQQDTISIKNIEYVAGNDKTPYSLKFELHNAHEGQSTEKGYIIMLARTPNEFVSYPDAFSGESKYLLEVERGETFQVARFRMVNGQFHLKQDPESIQILLFNRNAEILINTTYLVKKNAPSN